jgi:hypothetical protein
MTDPSFARDEIPVWRQALEGVGLVVALTFVVALTGFLVALLVSLIF